MKAGKHEHVGETAQIKSDAAQRPEPLHVRIATKPRRSEFPAAPTLHDHVVTIEPKPGGANLTR
jgi:hypothetical protein